MIYKGWKITIQSIQGYWWADYDAQTGEGYNTRIPRETSEEAVRDAKREIDHIEAEIKRETAPTDSQ